MDPSYRAAVFKFVAPGEGTISISLCGLTNHDTIWEIYRSSDGTLRSSTAKHIMGKDEGCATEGPTEGSYTGIKQGVTYYILVRQDATDCVGGLNAAAAADKWPTLWAWRMTGT